MSGRACIACGGAQWTPIFRGLQRCSQCGFVTARELPDAGQLAAIYNGPYFTGDEYADYLGDRRVHERNFRHRHARLTAIAGPIESLFEVGCAYGFWLATAKARGVRAAAGVDICEEPVRYARDVLGVDARCGAFEDVPITPGQYRAFCMWDTVEHLAHPESHVARIASLLPAGGWFFLTTGDIGSPAASRQGERWRLIHPPTHLQYFSRQTVARLLRRHGLETVHVESSPVWRSLHGSLVGLERFGHGAARAAARVARRIVPVAVAQQVQFPLDLGDIMLVCARKP